ncbi:MAG TPA: hypothetical protein VLU46_07110 [Thermoanaerobaculia bacterium]|nr:hypothetical protein [Thermoanaerobaculia bacterium]
MNPECQKYLEDPEGNGAHLAACDSCRALAESLEASVVRPRSSVDLPLAPWEGATYRAWPLAVAAVVVVGLLTFLLFVMTGTSPAAFIGDVPSAGVYVATLRHFGAAAPGFVVVLFVVVNVLFFALLRRAPKGIDV